MRFRTAVSLANDDRISGGNWYGACPGTVCATPAGGEQLQLSKYEEYRGFAQE